MIICLSYSNDYIADRMKYVDNDDCSVTREKNTTRECEWDSQHRASCYRNRSRSFMTSIDNRRESPTTILPFTTRAILIIHRSHKQHSICLCSHCRRPTADLSCVWSVIEIEEANEKEKAEHHSRSFIVMIDVIMWKTKGIWAAETAHHRSCDRDNTNVIAIKMSTDWYAYVIREFMVNKKHNANKVHTVIWYDL